MPPVNSIFREAPVEVIYENHESIPHAGFKQFFEIMSKFTDALFYGLLRFALADFLLVIENFPTHRAHSLCRIYHIVYIANGQRNTRRLAL